MITSLRLFRTAPNEMVLEADGTYFDLSPWLARPGAGDADESITLRAARQLTRSMIYHALRTSEWPVVGAPRDVLVPIEPERVGKILALGKNFKEHAAEFGEQVPEQPLFFNKLPETLVPHGATVGVPSWYTARVDHEAELAVVIGRNGYEIAEESAMDYVAGYTVANDLTARTLQGDDRKLKHPWFRAKNLDGFCPLGPCFVPRQYLDVGDLRVTARVVHPDGSVEARQDASTRDLIVTVPQAIHWLSKHLTLRVGDVILMGTPAGVGPLLDGDEVLCAVEKIGELRTRIARPARA